MPNLRTAVFIIATAAALGFVALIAPAHAATPAATTAPTTTSTTQPTPSLLRAFPNPSRPIVNPLHPITLEFDHPSITTPSLNPPLAGTWTALGHRRLRFTPTHPVAAGTVLTVTSSVPSFTLTYTYQPRIHHPPSLTRPRPFARSHHVRTRA